MLHLSEWIALLQEAFLVSCSCLWFVHYLLEKSCPVICLTLSALYMFALVLYPWYYCTPCLTHTVLLKVPSVYMMMFVHLCVSSVRFFWPASSLVLETYASASREQEDFNAGFSLFQVFPWHIKTLWHPFLSVLC